MKKGLIISISLISIVVIIFTILLILNNSLDFNGWSKFKKEMKINHSSIKYIDMYSNRHTLFCDFNLSKEISENDAKKIFNETKAFLMSEKVFNDLKKVHLKKYHSDFLDICIDIDFSKDDKKIDYRFFSSYFTQKGQSKEFNGFKNWYIEHDRITKEYVEEDK